MQKIVTRGAFFSLILAMLSFFIFVSGCGGGGVITETFPGSNVGLDGSVNWEKAITTKDQDATTKLFGGYYSDGGYCVRPTHDGGYIVAGYSQSTDGTLTNLPDGYKNHGNGDVWIIKFSSGGTIEWQKCYGGSEYDCAYSIQETKDNTGNYNGYVFSGVTCSHDGDVQSRKGKTATDNDMWIVKITDEGALVWETYAGSTNMEYARSIWQTNDRGFVVAGYQGDGAQNNNAYILRFDNTGSQGDPPSVKWSKIIGGSGNDCAESIQQTSDGGYVFAGFTTSTSGTGISGNHGGYDALIVKLVEVEDQTGSNANIEWSHCLGGSYGDEAYSIQQTPDNGYIIAGETKSNNGDVNGNNPNNYDCCWVVKLDSTGNSVEWQKCINNGLYGCYGRNVQQTSDAGYVVTGNVYYSFSTYNSYIAKLSGTGELMWVEAPGGTGPDYGYSVCEVTGNYIVVGETYSANVYGEINHGGADLFLVNIAEAPKLLSIKNVLVSPTVFKPYDEITTITADIEATDFTPTNLYWEIKITDNDGNTIKTLAGGTSSSIRAIWDGLKDDGSYACGDADNIFKLDDRGQIIRPEYTSITYKGSYNIKISASCNESSTTSSTTVNVDHHPLEVFPYNQQDPRWNDAILDHCPNLPDNTIGHIGCALTSSSIMIAYHNRLFGGLIVNPLNLNNALNDYAGFQSDGSGAILWARIPRCLKSIGLVVNVKFNGAQDYNSDIIDQEIANDCPPIVGILHPDPNKNEGSMHFVSVKGKMGKDKHIISDPGYKKYYEDRHLGDEYNGIKFEDLYLEDYLNNSTTDAKKITKLDWIVKFMPVNGSWPFKSLGIAGIDETGSSVEYAIVDPQGRYLGYNPVDGITVENKHVITGEIPDAQYFYMPFSSLDSDSTLGKAKHLWVRNPVNGIYTLKVFGINASEHYWLDIGSDHPDEVSVPISGFVTPGQIIEYSINFSQTAGNIPAVSLKESINGSIELEPTTLNLNSNGNYVTAHISLPTGYNVQDIDIASLRLENSISALSHPSATCDNKKLMVKFDRQALVNYIKSKGITSGEVTLTVTGNVGNTSFKASDKIRVK